MSGKPAGAAAVIADVAKPHDLKKATTTVFDCFLQYLSRSRRRTSILLVERSHRVPFVFVIAGARCWSGAGQARA